MLNIYAVLDKKSGVLSNHFVTGDPFGKVKEQMSISLLQTFFKDKTNPYVLYGGDYELIFVGTCPDEIKMSDFPGTDEHVNLGQLLAASRSAFETTKNQTSPDVGLD